MKNKDIFFTNWNELINGLIDREAFVKKPVSVLYKTLKNVDNLSSELKEDMATILLARMMFLIGDNENIIIKNFLSNTSNPFSQDIKKTLVSGEIGNNISINSPGLLKSKKNVEIYLKELNKCIKNLQLLKETETVKKVSFMDLMNKRFPTSEHVFNTLETMKDVFSNISLNEFNQIQINIVKKLEKEILLNSDYPTLKLPTLIKCQKIAYETNVMEYIIKVLKDPEIKLSMEDINDLYYIHEKNSLNLDKIIDVKKDMENGVNNNLNITISEKSKDIIINITEMSSLMNLSPIETMRYLARFRENMGNTDEDNQRDVPNIVNFIKRATYKVCSNNIWQYNLIFEKPENIDITVVEAMNVFKKELIKLCDYCYKEKELDKNFLITEDDNYIVDGQAILQKFLMEKDIININEDSKVLRKNRVKKF